MLLLDLREHLAELFFEPGMQHGVGRRDDAFGSHDAGSRTEKGQQFGCPPALVLVRLESWLSFGLPRGPRLRDGLVGPRFIFVQLHNPRCFRLLTRQLNQSFFSGVSTS